MQLGLFGQVVLERILGLGSRPWLIGNESVGGIYDGAFAGPKEGRPAGGMILHFKNRAAVIARVPKSLHIGMAVGEMLDRAAGNVSRATEN